MELFTFFFNIFYNGSNWGGSKKIFKMTMHDFLKSFKKGMEEFGYTIAIIVNSILLSVVYFFGVGITSLIAKIVGKNFLEEELNNSQTYWENLNLGKNKLEAYYRQF